MRLIRLPGVVAYATVILWFLLTILAPAPARALTAEIAIPVSDIAPSIEAALIEKGISPTASVIFDDPDLIIAHRTGAAPAFASVSVNPASGRFLIRLAREDGRPGPLIAGRAVITTEFPVLVRPVARGEIISENDIALVSRNDLRAEFYETDLDNIVGKQTRRALTAHAPFRRSDLKAPLLVQRGALVRLTYEARGLRLTHQAIAQAPGSLGDVVKFENTHSERSLRAIITGPNEARVVGARNAAL